MIILNNLLFSLFKCIVLNVSIRMKVLKIRTVLMILVLHIIRYCLTSNSNHSIEFKIIRYMNYILRIMQILKLHHHKSIFDTIHGILMILSKDF